MLACFYFRNNVTPSRSLQDQYTFSIFYFSASWRIVKYLKKVLRSGSLPTPHPNRVYYRYTTSRSGTASSVFETIAYWSEKEKRRDWQSVPDYPHCGEFSSDSSGVIHNPCFFHKKQLLYKGLICHV
jgi:hypothetical protein